MFHDKNNWVEMIFFSSLFTRFPFIRIVDILIGIARQWIMKVNIEEMQFIRTQLTNG